MSHITKADIGKSCAVDGMILYACANDSLPMNYRFPFVLYKIKGNDAMVMKDDDIWLVPLQKITLQ